MSHREHWTVDKLKYATTQITKGRRIPDIARELNVAPGQLRGAMRYYGFLKPRQKEPSHAPASPRTPADGQDAASP